MLSCTALLLICFLPLIFCAEDYYQLLGISKQATDKEIKSAYRVLSKRFHPDKNPGNDSAAKKFVEVAEAYDTLSTPETRRIYDQYGAEGLAQHKASGHAPNHDPFDLFSRFFGGGGGGGFHSGQRRGPAMEVTVHLPLRDFYAGASVQFSVEKQAVCDMCDGSGSADGEVEPCSDCGGRGVRILKHQLAPGIFQQVQSMCGTCGGKGQRVKHACKTCQGAKVVRKVVTHDLHIQRGVPRGTRIAFEEEADESPEWAAGDLLVQLAEKEPERGDSGSTSDAVFWRRRGSELHAKEVLSLREAWMGGWTRNLTHLDGHIVRLGRKRGQVVQPGHVELVPGEGMPLWEEDLAGGGEGKPREGFGALVVEYVVVLPDQLPSGMEKEAWALWEKWRKKGGVSSLDEALGRRVGEGSGVKDEL
ncbi:MAG: DnaJ- protein scj1 [Trizodia sp. TS-e1964]|nr:MAG: DnaJ- protein scj1 [Trizodia sp. TS-e1964]